MPKNIEEILKERIMILDGAMGTMIQNREMQEEDFRNEELKDHPKPLKGNNDLLSVTRPDVIKDIHRSYFEAGADFAGTNTFSSTSVAQEDYGLESPEWVYRLNVESVKAAREVADEFTAKNPEKPRFVAGAVGPTNKTTSLSPDVNDPGYRAIYFDELKAAYYEQIVALIDGGVDAILIETIFDTLNAKIALFAAQEAMDDKGVTVPIMVSGTITDASGRTLSGQTTEAFLISVSHVPLMSIGLNCALGAEDLKPYLETLSQKAPFFVSAYPNAGLPNEFGEYDQTPDEMADQIEVFLKEGYINLVGGCCGTTPEHLAEIVSRVDKYQPRVLKVGK